MGAKLVGIYIDKIKREKYNKIMIINVVEIIDKFYIRADCKYGIFVGKWMEENIENNGKYKIEIGYNNILSYEILNDKKYYIGNINGKNIICGLIIGEDGDFVQYLDIGGGDTIMMTDIKENNLKNRFVKLELDELQLFPIDY
jgi:hypothetical protein